MLCRRTTVFPIECVIRGYHLGLGLEGICRVRARWPARSSRRACIESAKLEPAIFSPATKAETGHDENITVARVREILGDEVADTLEQHGARGLCVRRKISREQRHHHRRHQVRVRQRSPTAASS